MYMRKELKNMTEQNDARNPQDVALIPASFSTVREERFAPEGRLWQAVPSAVRTAGGRVFASYMADNEASLKLSGVRLQRWGKHGFQALLLCLSY